MEGWIIKAALNGSALHTHTQPTAHTCSCNVSPLEIELVTRPDRAGSRIMAENNCKICFDYSIKHNVTKYLYFLRSITQNIALCSLLAPLTPLFSSNKQDFRKSVKAVIYWQAKSRKQPG